MLRPPGRPESPSSSSMCCPSWHEAEIFTDQEFAALTLAESLTVLDKTEDRDAIAAEVAQHS
jgi:hypothetical protein